MRWAPVLLLPAIMLAGCSEGPIPIQTASVNGTATFDGKPLEGYRVFFYVTGSASQEPATGKIGPDGKFSLRIRDQEGAIVGMNHVWLVYNPEMPENDGRGPLNVVPFPEPKVKLPEKYTNRDTSGITVEVPPEGLTDYKLELE